MVEAVASSSKRDASNFAVEACGCQRAHRKEMVAGEVFQGTWIVMQSASASA